MLVHTIKEVREQIKEWKKEGLTVGLVPTMGALHNGHLSLIKKAVAKCDRVVVSVFVNPIQFCPGEDLDKYPRTLEADQKLCEDNGVNIVFAPTPSEMYGDCQMRTNDFLTYVIPPFFYVNKLCGKSRVGHFDGVCTVVNKLFNIAQPDFAFFGQKDAQQLIIIKKMVKDLNIPVEIIGKACFYVAGIKRYRRNSVLCNDIPRTKIYRRMCRIVCRYHYGKIFRFKRIIGNSKNALVFCSVICIIVACGFQQCIFVFKIGGIGRGNVIPDFRTDYVKIA